MGSKPTQKLQYRRLGSMTNEYTTQAARDEQERLRQGAEAQNIRRLQKKVNDARDELYDAQLERQNRMMSQVVED